MGRVSSARSAHVEAWCSSRHFAKFAAKVPWKHVNFTLAGAQRTPNFIFVIISHKQKHLLAFYFWQNGRKTHSFRIWKTKQTSSQSTDINIVHLRPTSGVLCSRIATTDAEIDSGAFQWFANDPFWIHAAGQRAHRATDTYSSDGLIESLDGDERLADLLCLMSSCAESAVQIPFLIIFERKNHSDWLAFLWSFFCGVCSVHRPWKKSRFMSVGELLLCALLASISVPLHFEYIFLLSTSELYRLWLWQVWRRTTKKMKTKSNISRSSTVRRPVPIRAQRPNEWTDDSYRRQIDICVFHPTAIGAPW